MERSQLIKEHDCYKRNVIRFSVLTGIIIALLFTILTFFIISLIVLSNSESESLTEAIAMFGLIFSYLALVLYMAFILPAADMFTAFIIINAIKLGKRNNLLNKLKVEEQAILVEENENN